jgi:hypothetical protein
MRSVTSVTLKRKLTPWWGSYRKDLNQVDERFVEDVLREDRCEQRFICILAWASFSAARSSAQRIAESTSAKP